MYCLPLARILGMCTFVVAFAHPQLGPDALRLPHPGLASAEDAGGAEKEAFSEAKELGTREAWDAYLANFPTGFHADMARAYLKKLEGSQQAETPAPPPAAALPPTDDFPIVAGSWGGVVRAGPGQSYKKLDSLEEGQSVTLMARTDVMEDGYPWFKIAYEDDSRGYQWGGILCAVGTERPDVYKTCPPGKKAKSADSNKTSKTASKPKSCSSGRVMIEGKCIKKTSAVSYCGPGFRPEGGKCVPGYKAPPANAPLSGEQRKAVGKGCPKGQVWNSAEGCHYDD